MLGFDPEASPFSAAGDLVGASISWWVIVGLPRSSPSSPYCGRIARLRGFFAAYAAWVAFASVLNGAIFVLKW